MHEYKSVIIVKVTKQMDLYTSGLPIAQMAVPYETIPTTSCPSPMANGPPESPFKLQNP